MVLLLKYFMMKSQIRRLSKQIEDLVYNNSEKMLNISLIDRDLERFVGILNQYNKKQRKTVARTLQHEEQLRESIANISHDLRTPLTVILGHLQILHQYDLPGEQMQRVNTALRKAEWMKNLVADFYSLSLLDTENEEPQKENINLSNLLINMLTENAPAFEKHNLFPEIVLPKQTIFLLSDRSMVERIFQNLVTNAIRYSGGSVKIVLSADENQRIKFSIENTLAYPDSVDVNRIFERFYTGDKSRHTQSTGIGLAIVDILAKKIEAEMQASKNHDALKIEVLFSNPGSCRSKT